MTAPTVALPLPTQLGDPRATDAAAAGKSEQRSRDIVVPVLVALSLAAHVALILPLLIDREAAPPVPQEIPVEVIEAPPPQPPPAPAAKAQPAKSEPAKQPPRQAAAEQPKAQPKPTARQAAQQAAQQRQAAQQQQAAEKQAEQQQKAAQRQETQQRQVAERMESLLGTGSMPAIVLPGSSDAGDEEVDYKQLVLSKVAKAKPEGRSRGIPGAASVAFTLGAQGEVVSCSIVRKSVDPKLDAEAIAMIQRGAPYPAPPAGGQRDFVVTLRFMPLP